MADPLTLGKMKAFSNEPKMELGPIQAVLGEETPDITPTPLGRLRLITALKNKFGPNYKNIQSANGALQHFDSEMKFFRSYRQAKGVS